MRVPPGRAGRLWLIEHRALAERAVDVLRRKQRLLREERERRYAPLAELREEWRRSCAAAEGTMRRALERAGRHRLAVMDATARGAAVDVSWGAIFGVPVPVAARAVVPAQNLLEAAALGGSAAFDENARAARAAVETAARLALAEEGLRALDRALAETSRHVRLLSRHRLPELDAALRECQERLDEGERQDLIQVRWAARRRAAAHPLTRG